MGSQSFNVGFRQVRREQLRSEPIEDNYKQAAKIPEPAACSGCGVVYRSGRWQWGAKPADAKAVLCPACHRIKDHSPAGLLEITGNYFAAHRDELFSLMRHHEEREKAEHPLSRIIATEESPASVLVTTTNLHLARDLGEALHRAHDGELEYHYNDAENMLRVHWRRWLS